MSIFFTIAGSQAVMDFGNKVNLYERFMFVNHREFWEQGKARIYA